MANQAHINQEIIDDPWNTVTTESATDWLDTRRCCSATF